jgi:quinol monooxygenase YgiN
MTTPSSSRAKVMSALLTPIPEKQREFLQTLRSLREEFLRQPGCLDCAVGQAEGSTPSFFIFMVWKDQAHLEAHMESDPFRILLGAVSVLSAPATFRFIAADATFSPQDLLSRGGHPPAHGMKPAS